jgi:hypothetical protein
MAPTRITGEGVSDTTARLWSTAKRKLSFCQLRIDGDDEGTLHLDHTCYRPQKAKVIRQVMAIWKRQSHPGELDAI